MRSFLWALGGTLFTFIMTALGAALVFCFKNRISDRTNRLCFGFSGGVMSAAAVFSLLLPAAEQAKAAGQTLQVLLNDILDFTKIGTGNMKIVENDYPIKYSLAHLLQRNEEKAGE